MCWIKSSTMGIYQHTITHHEFAHTSQYYEFWEILIDWISTPSNKSLTFSQWPKPGDESEPFIGIGHLTWWHDQMETLSMSLAFLCGEFTGHRWIPRIKASDAELRCFLWSAPEWTVEQTVVRLVIRNAIALIMTSFLWIAVCLNGNISLKGICIDNWSWTMTYTRAAQSSKQLPYYVWIRVQHCQIFIHQSKLPHTK